MAFKDIVTPSGISGIGGVSQRRYEVQRQNNFEFVVFGIDQTKSKDLTLAVNGIFLPTITVDVVDLNTGNQTHRVASTKQVFEAGDLRLKDFIGADMERICLEWHAQVYNPLSGNFGYASDYKKTANIYQYSPDGSAVRKWVLEGVFPTTYTPGDMTYDAGDLKEITMSISYDRAYREDMKDFYSSNTFSSNSEDSPIVDYNRVGGPLGF